MVFAKASYNNVWCSGLGEGNTIVCKGRVSAGVCFKLHLTLRFPG